MSEGILRGAKPCVGCFPQCEIGFARCKRLFWDSRPKDTKSPAALFLSTFEHFGGFGVCTDILNAWYRPDFGPPTQNLQKKPENGFRPHPGNGGKMAENRTKQRVKNGRIPMFRPFFPHFARQGQNPFFGVPFFKNLLMPLFLMGCFPVDFQDVKRPLRTKSVKRPIKDGKRPINERKRPIKAKVLVGVSVGSLMGCFRAPPPWRKTAPLKRPIKRSMIFFPEMGSVPGTQDRKL